jgi:hypothetical protein
MYKALQHLIWYVHKIIPGVSNYLSFQALLSSFDWEQGILSLYTTTSMSTHKPETSCAVLCTMENNSIE